MNILQFPTPIPMTNGEYPQFKFAVFGDGLMAVTTAGYLNQAAISSGMPLSNADVIMALYSFNAQTQSGTFGIFTVDIASTNGQITLTSWSAGGGGGGVVLPTVANNIAHFTDTAGTISSDPDNVTNAGNIAAGLSGTAGSLISFPPSAASGTLNLTAIDNMGDFVVTINNAPSTQDTAYTLPNTFTFATATLTGILGSIPNGNLVSSIGPLADGILTNSGIAASDVATAITNGFKSFDNNLDSTQLASGGQAFIIPAGSHVYKIRNIVLNLAFGMSGGDRDIIITDGTTIYTTIASADVITPSNAVWGSTTVPFPAVACNTNTAFGQGLYAMYSGGTTDYTAGLISVTTSYVTLF